MLHRLLLSLLCVSSAQTILASPQSFRIAFGSCAREDRPQTIWEQIAREQPDRFLFLGDNIYGDTTDPAVLRQKYAQLAAIPAFQAFRSQVPVLATWDDHDYGRNDAGSEFVIKRESQAAFLDFLGIAADSPRRQQEGVYSSEMITWEETRIQILLLDTRYFRGPLYKTGRGYQPNPDKSVPMLGEAQWAWLKQELQKPADLRIIASSIQVLSQEHSYEKWANFPGETQRLWDLIASTKAEGVVFLSGDRHLGEFSVLELDKIAYPLYDFTASGMTEGTKDQINNERNLRRVPQTRAHQITQYGWIELQRDPESRSVQLTMSLKDGQGKELEKLQFPLETLRRRELAKASQRSED